MTTLDIDHELKYQILDKCIEVSYEQDESLLSVLHNAQRIFGYVPKEVQTYIARKMNIPPAKVYSTVTFYPFFSMVPKGRYRIHVCMGTTCFIQGAQDILDEFTKELGITAGQTTDDQMFSIDTNHCAGTCGLAPVVAINDRVYGRVKRDEVKKIVDELILDQ